MTIRYVSNTTGLNTNDGLTALTPYQTLTKALTVFTNGDTIYVAPGTYPEKTTFSRALGVGTKLDIIGDTTSEIFTDIEPGPIVFDGTYTLSLAVQVAASNIGTVKISNIEYRRWYSDHLSNTTYAASGKGCFFGCVAFTGSNFTFNNCIFAGGRPKSPNSSYYSMGAFVICGDNDVEFIGCTVSDVYYNVATMGCVCALLYTSAGPSYNNNRKVWFKNCYIKSDVYYQNHSGLPHFITMEGTSEEVVFEDTLIEMGVSGGTIGNETAAMGYISLNNYCRAKFIRSRLNLIGGFKITGTYFITLLSRAAMIFEDCDFNIDITNGLHFIRSNAATNKVFIDINRCHFKCITEVSSSSIFHGGGAKVNIRKSFFEGIGLYYVLSGGIHVSCSMEDVIISRLGGYAMQISSLNTTLNATRILFSNVAAAPLNSSIAVDGVAAGSPYIIIRGFSARNCSGYGVNCGTSNATSFSVCDANAAGCTSGNSNGSLEFLTAGYEEVRSLPNVILPDYSATAIAGARSAFIPVVPVGRADLDFIAEAGKPTTISFQLQKTWAANTGATRFYINDELIQTLPVDTAANTTVSITFSFTPILDGYQKLTIWGDNGLTSYTVYTNTVAHKIMIDQFTVTN